MLGLIIAVVVGIGSIGLGLKGFTAKGLPLSKDKNITGTPAAIIGVVCILIGLGFLGMTAFTLIAQATGR